MKKTIIHYQLILGLCLALFYGCETDEPDPEPENNVIYVTEAITAPTTWIEGNIYLVDINGDFRVEALLTIEPDVIVKCLEDTRRIIVHEEGAIQAVGTADKPIIFTSLNDDLHGGDNTDNGTIPPAVQDWGNIEFNEVTGSVLSYCHFYYGGGRLLTTVEVIRSTIDIDHCVFAHNLGGEHFGYSGVVDLDLANPESSFTDNVFFDNVLPLSINADLNMDDSNQFFDPENPEVGNVMNGIFTNSYNVTGDITWLENEVAYVVANDFHLTVQQSGSLTLANDVVIKIVEGTNIDLDYRDDAIINFNGPGVFFTSFHDDSLKGDTNGNGSSTLPEEGDWEGVITTHTPLTYAVWDNILFDEVRD